jgi:hypothetical protein
VLSGILRLVLVFLVVAAAAQSTVWLRKRRGVPLPEPADVLGLDTTRHSAVLREILTTYGSTSEITIDAKTYGPADVPRLLDEWCTNRAIGSTQYFLMTSAGNPIFGWDCSHRDLWANRTESAFVDDLQKKGLLRVGHPTGKQTRA